MCAQSLSCVRLCDPMDIAQQAPLSMGFSRQEYCSGLPFPSLGELIDPGIKPTSLRSPALSGRFRFDPWIRKIPWRRKWQPTPVLLLPGKFHGWRSPVGSSPWDCRVRHNWATSLSLFLFFTTSATLVQRSTYNSGKGSNPKVLGIQWMWYQEYRAFTIW